MPPLPLVLLAAGCADLFGVLNNKDDGDDPFTDAEQDAILALATAICGFASCDPDFWDGFETVEECAEYNAGKWMSDHGDCLEEFSAGEIEACAAGIEAIPCSEWPDAEDPPECEELGECL